MSYGCPYCKMDMMRQVEYCKVTDEPTHENIICDFGYEKCSHYIEAHKPIKGQGAGRKSCADDRSDARYVQTSIFGKSGEKPINV